MSKMEAFEKNLAKTKEGYSKSHFSHVRDEVGKTTLLPLILDVRLGRNRVEIA